MGYFKSLSIRIGIQSVVENLSILLPLSSILRGIMVTLQELEHTYEKILPVETVHTSEGTNANSSTTLIVSSNYSMIE